ncbi:hypothetical protein Fot_35260 [Forsythia ovata]|uniref:Uncharacterized protein n=1 Tax=Forsythia ovata TaxID=205694 RepID=A0ABD1SP17_9LAMI
MEARSPMLIKEAEMEVCDMELSKKSSETAFQNADKIIKDWDHFQDQVTWLRESLSELKKEVRTLTEDMDELKPDLARSEDDVAEFLTKYDHANHAQEVTAKALVEANSESNELVDKIAQFEDAVEALKAECSSLKEKNHELERSTEDAVRAGVENFLDSV